jgi:hypothetical protein
MGLRAADGDPRRFVGESRFVRYLPVSFAALALVGLIRGDLLAFAIFAIPALVLTTRMPWRVEIDASGIALFFGLGGYRFFDRERVRLRAGLGGAVVMPTNPTTLGFPITTGLVERDRTELRRLAMGLGFDVVD